MISCGQACPYNTLNGCKVKEYNGICPLTNMALADMEAAKDAKPQTNADRIRAMSDEELAKLLLDGCRGAKCSEQPQNEMGSVNCFKCRVDWLRQPAKDGENDG